MDLQFSFFLFFLTLGDSYSMARRCYFGSACFRSLSRSRMRGGSAGRHLLCCMASSRVTRTSYLIMMVPSLTDSDKRAKYLASIVISDSRVNTYADIGKKAFGVRSMPFVNFMFCFETFSVGYASLSPCSILF